MTANIGEARIKLPLPWATINSPAALQTISPGRGMALKPRSKRR